MAKDVQKRMEGTYDKPVRVVLEKAEEYNKLLRRRMTTQEKENVCRMELIDVMKEHHVETVELDGDIVTLEHIEGLRDARTTDNGSPFFLAYIDHHLQHVSYARPTRLNCI